MQLLAQLFHVGSTQHRLANNMVPAYAYARYSSDNQREESIESQLSYIVDYAKNNDIEILNTYTDHAASGTRTEGRDQFQRMLRDVKNKHEVKAVLVWDLSRFARNAEDAFRIENQLLKLGIEIIAVTQPMRTKRDDGRINTSVLTYRRMMHVMSEASSFQNSEMTAAHMYSQSQRANIHGHHPHLAGMAPYGYKLSERKHYKDHRYLEIDEREAPAVRLAWQWADQGLGYRTIADRLNQMGYRTRRGSLFSVSSIHDITHNATYAGIYTYGEKRYNRLTTGIPEDNPDVIVVPDGAPALIDRTIYERVSLMLDKRKTGTRSVSGNLYILSGLTYCAYCGSRMVGDSGAKTRATRYRCSGSDCTNKRWTTSRPMLEKNVMALLVDLFLRHADTDRIAEAINEVEQNEGKYLLLRIKNTMADLVKLEKKISALMDLLIEDGIRNQTKKKILETQRELNAKKLLLKQMKDTSQRLDIEGDIDKVREVINAGVKAFDEWNEPRLRQLANIFIERIEIAHYGELKIFWRNQEITHIPPSEPDPGSPMRRKRSKVCGVDSDIPRDCQINPHHYPLMDVIKAILKK